MRLGTSIVLIALGAILTFALNVSVSGVNLDVVGWILMLVGVLGILLELAVWGPRSRRRVTHTEGYAAPADAPVRHARITPQASRTGRASHDRRIAQPDGHADRPRQDVDGAPCRFGSPRARHPRLPVRRKRWRMAHHDRGGNGARRYQPHDTPPC